MPADTATCGARVGPVLKYELGSGLITRPMTWRTMFSTSFCICAAPFSSELDAMPRVLGGSEREAATLAEEPSDWLMEPIGLLGRSLVRGKLAKPLVGLLLAPSWTCEALPCERRAALTDARSSCAWTWGNREGCGETALGTFEGIVPNFKLAGLVGLVGLPGLVVVLGGPGLAAKRAGKEFLARKEPSAGLVAFEVEEPTRGDGVLNFDALETPRRY